MSSFRSVPPEDESGTANEFSNSFRQKSFCNGPCLWPRRYVICVMLFLLTILKQWRTISVNYTITTIIFTERDADKHLSIGNWTLEELDNYSTAKMVIDLLVQMPGALLIFIFASHKYLLTSTLIASILHMLTPAALQHHSATLIVLLLVQSLIQAPIFTAIMSMWKDWAPPYERTKLMTFSMLGMFISSASTPFYQYAVKFFTSYENFYISGIAGLIWALLWYNITSDTPQNDPLISENELLYLENSIPSDNPEEHRLKDIPWKSIIISKQVIILCIIFFKMACSDYAISIGGILFSIHLETIYNTLLLFILFLSAFVLIILCSAILADYLIKRYRGRTLLIRKCFLCGGYILQCVFMLGIMSTSELNKAIFFIISYIMYAASLPGFLTLVLDVSPRFVSIIAGFIYTFTCIGNISIAFLLKKTLVVLHLHSGSWLFLFDGVFTFLCAILFAKWGDVEEPLWSLNFSSTYGSDKYRRAPKPEHQDDLNLVPESTSSL